MKQRQGQIGLGVAVLAASLLPLAAQNYPSPEAPWVQSKSQAWFTLGPVIRGGMKMRVSGSSYAHTSGLTGLGEPDVYGNRNYDNGYVRADSSEGGGVEPNTTWNWGYNEASTAGQYDATAGTLAFQSQDVPHYSAFASGRRVKEDLTGAGLQIQGGVPMVESGRWSLDLVAGFSAFWNLDSRHRINASMVNVADTYDVAGINSPAFANLGHRGTHDGPFDPVATPPYYTTIPNLPSRALSPSAVVPATRSSISLDVDQNLYQLKLGPQLGLQAGPRLALVLSPAFSLTLADVDIKRSEVFAYRGTVTRWSDRADETKLMVGLGITAGANLDLGKGWFAGVFGGYEWVPDETKINVGPNTVTLDASGWVAGLTLGKQF